jgi:hypothetical protein
MATNLYIEVANRKGINSPSDHNPIVPPDITLPGTYNFNLYFLDFGNPDTYHRYSSASIILNLRVNGPPTSGTFALSFLGYTTGPISINATNQEIQDAFVALKSVGVGNAAVSGDPANGWLITFDGNRAGIPQPPVSCDPSGSSPSSVATISQVTVGGVDGANDSQLVDINQNPVATTNKFTELTTGSLWGWTTSSGLVTTGVNSLFWIEPAYDVILEVQLFVGGARSGTDGVTSLTSARAGTDGQTIDDGRGRSGTDGSIQGSPGRNVSADLYGASDTGSWGPSAGSFSGLPFPSTISAVGGTFLASDIGRPLSGSIYLPAGCTIVDVNTGGSSPGSLARISPTTANKNPPKGGYAFTATLGSQPTANQFISSSAVFTQADVGHVLNCSSLPAGTTITTFQNSISVLLSNSGPIGSSLSWSIVAQVSNIYESASAAFTPADVGAAFSGTDMPSGTTIATWIDATHVTLSNLPTAIATGLNWTIAASISNTYQSATAAFTSGDVGKILSGDDIPANTLIQAFTNSTHVVLSKTPTVVGTGLNWSIINTAPGSSGAPVVTRIVTGDSTHQETQQIAFFEVPIFGSFTLQDGSGGQPVTADIPVPLDVGEITSALNSTYPANAPFTVTTINPITFQIQWGLVGSQSLIIVNDAKLIYDNVVLRLVLVQGVGLPPGGGTPSLIPKVVTYDGDFSSAKACGAIRTETIPNSGGAIKVMQRFNQLGANRRVLAPNSGGPFGTLLVDESGASDVGGGIVEFDRIYASLPPGRVDQIWGGRTYTGTSRTYSGSTLVDIQLFSISVSNMLTRYRQFTAGYPAWHFGGTPAGVIIHYINGASTLLTYNGFQNFQGTFYAAWAWSVDITRFMGGIWQMDWVIG